MKYVICPLYVMFVVTFFCRGNNDEENTKVLQYNDKTQLVRRIIGGPSLLFLSHSVFFRNDYPICVRSHLIEHSAAGYHHILAYFDRKRKKQEIKGPIVTRDTYMHVYERERDKMPLFVVNAYYTGTNITDSKISAYYNILFAKPMCFVVATQQVTVTSTGNRIDRRQARTSACLLWRTAFAPEKYRPPCREAFKRHCARYHGYKFTYTRSICGPFNYTMPSLPVTAKVK
uniref:Putative lipocalin n=1 Tax=Rhipicephalus microplus TaxID=6941 RepID=A0A6G5A2E9_RHIMP